ncbi:MAG: complex I subunit 1 family protein [Pyramidobacter sp.]|nr:complex I subunit 1 family protein [Pyramidobacter sp.]
MIIIQIVCALVAALLLSTIALLFEGLDRKGHARMQRRVGPPVTQGIWDFLKLLGKENITPRHAVKWLFNAAPAVSLTAILTAFAYIPMGVVPSPLCGYGDAITVMYLITLSSAALALGAFASGSPLANTGAQRELVLMMSFEAPLAVCIATVGWLITKSTAGLPAFALETYAHVSLWSLVGWSGFIGLICLTAAALLVIPAESGTGLMDIAEAKTEILEGLTIEYSGVNLALVHLALTLRSLAVCALITAIFIPFSISSLLSLPAILTAPVDIVWFWAKTLGVALFGVTYLRTIFGRLKIWQASGFYWSKIGLLALAGMVLVSIDVYMR